MLVLLALPALFDRMEATCLHALESAYPSAIHALETYLKDNNPEV